MNHDLYIARRMSLDSGQQKGSPSLTVALVGIVLAVVVMILSIAVVMGFKGEISGKIMHLDAHLKVTNAALGIDNTMPLLTGAKCVRPSPGTTLLPHLSRALASLPTRVPS